MEPTIERAFGAVSVSAYQPFDGKEAREVILPFDENAPVWGLPRRFDLETVIPWLFSSAELLGNAATSAVLRVLRFLLRRVTLLFAGIGKGLRRVFGAAFQKLSFQFARLERKIQSRKVAFAALREQPLSFKARLDALVRLFLPQKGERQTVRRLAWNVLFPAFALLLCICVFAVLRGSNAALDVSFGGTHLGYAENETVVNEAKERALRLLPLLQEEAGSDPFAGELRMRLCRAAPQSFCNSSVLCEAMLLASGESLVHACGVYIDGEFLCAVHNESDAAGVFDALLAPARKRAEADTMVGFVEEIRYEEGLFPDDPATLWDPIRLRKTLKQPKSEARYDTVRAGDYLQQIARRNGLSAAQLRALNPGFDFEHLLVGQKILVARQTDYVRIQVLKTRKRQTVLRYDTVRRESASLPAGMVQLVRPGQNGTAMTTEIVSYVNGEQTYYWAIASEPIQKAVDEILLVGASGSGLAAAQTAAGMIWPAVGAYSLSSGFGYRSARISGWSFHGGVDIVRSGGHSTGAPVVAAASGTVVVAQTGYRGYGHTVVIDHGGGLQTRYAHMQPGTLQVKVGDSVKQGEQIGCIGSTGNVTGPHLHFEVLKNGRKVNPLNYIR